MWLTGLCDELYWEYKVPSVYCDNQAAICLTERPGKHNKSKHIENKFHYVRKLVEDDRIRVSHVGTKDMVADTMTKGLSRVKFELFRKLMGVVSRAEAAESVGAQNNKAREEEDVGHSVYYLCRSCPEGQDIEQRIPVC
jgi:hypothetical protein